VEVSVQAPLSTASAAAVLSLLVVPSVASAADARWQPGEQHRWYLDHTHELPQLLWARGPENADARLAAVQIRAIVSCTADEAPVRPIAAQKIHCDFEQVAVAGRGMERESRQLDVVLRTFADRAHTIGWTYLLRRDGTVVDPDMTGLPPSSPRDNRTNQMLRRLLDSAMAGMEVGPPEGKVAVPAGPSEEWARRSPRAVMFPTTAGTAGSFRLRRKALDADDALIHTVSWGIGTIAPATTTLTMVTRAGGDAWLERGTGRLVHRQWWVHGDATPSARVVRSGEIAGSAQTSLTGPYGISAWRQAGYLARLDHVDGEPDVGRSGLEGWREGPSTELLERANDGSWRKHFPRPDDAVW
jgi:hypothetical protein